MDVATREIGATTRWLDFRVIVDGWNVQCAPARFDKDIKRRIMPSPGSRTYRQGQLFGWVKSRMLRAIDGRFKVMRVWELACIFVHVLRNFG